MYTTDDKTLCAIYFSQNGYNCAILLLLFLIETYTSYCAEKRRTLFLISWNFIPSKRHYPKRIDKILLLLQNWSVQKRCRKKKKMQLCLQYQSSTLLKIEIIYSLYLKEDKEKHKTVKPLLQSMIQFSAAVKISKIQV